MTITLYDFALAPSPRRTRIFLAEKGVAYDNVQVDLGSAEQLSDGFRKINPACTVPALKLEDGTVLTENDGIAAYLEAAYPEPPLLGVTPAEKGLVANWNARVVAEGLSAAAETLRNTSKGMVDRATTGPINFKQIPELAERGHARLTAFMDTLNDRLKGRDFVAIDCYSYADITALVLVDFAKWVKIEPTEAQENLRRWHKAVSARPSASA
ncbi:MAG: glutathione S-transferase [Rhodobiaceae bacterium]|nr:MAG: glutathione S-transferase [Rhodobiaceae bacterium]